ncbi:MAG: ABC transporter, phosphonate, periplasmic substrate-binding protein [Candidatus Izimaplasma bacterium HR2]|nr:MAG: ABC transporter, phosphonate, periplasmic substrate-binding protein [Candidatus Izimaplasma bacterium HR2]
MKKLLSLTLLLVSVFVLSACGQDDTMTELNVVFVPSRDAVDILEVTAPLEALLLAELNALGYEFEKINIEVSADYAAAAEAASAGTADVVFLPGGTYVTYADSLVPILAAARNSLTKSSSNAADWNDGLATQEIPNSKDATTYLSLLIAGPSPAGRTLAAIINGGDDLTWDDIKDVSFCTGGATSSASYIYPNLWLTENFSKTIEDMPNATDAGGYGGSISALEAETCDIAAIYGDARMHNPFTAGDIFALTDVIAVTVPIANDGIQVGGHINVKLAEALQIAFMNLINDDANAAIFDIYSHSAYSPMTFVGYEGTRKVSGLDTILD